MTFLFFNDTATTEIYTLSLHDALPICGHLVPFRSAAARAPRRAGGAVRPGGRRRSTRRVLPTRGRSRSDRKSTRLNSSHANISYAVFCLKKKKKVHFSFPSAISLDMYL